MRSWYRLLFGIRMRITFLISDFQILLVLILTNVLTIICGCYRGYRAIDAFDGRGGIFPLVGALLLEVRFIKFILLGLLDLVHLLVSLLDWIWLLQYISYLHYLSLISFRIPTDLATIYIPTYNGMSELLCCWTCITFVIFLIVWREQQSLRWLYWRTK